MKKITLLCAMLLFSIVGFSQFTEGFETEIPATFTINNGGAAAGNTWVHSGAPTGGAHSGTGVASITYEATAHSDDLVTPQITVTAGLNDQLSFWIKSRSGTFLEPYEVLLSTTDTAPASFTNTLQVSEEAANDWVEKTFNLTAYVGQNIYIAIRATGTNEWQLFVDDVVSTAIPACPNIMNIVAGNMVAPSSVDLTWDAAAGATGYNWEIQPQGVAQGTAGEIGSGVLAGTSVTASGLVGGTTYTAYVQSDCGGDTGVYQSIDFTFILAPVNDECANAIGLTVNTDYACGTVTAGTTVGASDSAETDGAISGTANTDVWFSFVATGATHRVSLTNVVNQGGGTSTSTDMGMAVYDATGGCAALVFTDTSDPDTLNLTGLTPATTYYVRVYGWFGTIQYNNFDICIGSEPACPDPTLGIGNFTAPNNADISLGAAAGATGYNWEIQPQGIAQGTAGALDSGTTALIDFPATNLVDGTDYTLYVQSDCGGTLGGYNSLDFTFNLPPANNDCATPTVLIPGGNFAANEVISNIAGSTDSGELATTCSAFGGGDVWFSVTVPADGNITIETNNNSSSLTDSAMEVYSGACGALVSVECDDDDSLDGNFSLVDLTGRTPGEVLLVRVWSYNGGAQDSFKISAYNTTLSVSDLKVSEGFKAYPNPVVDELTISAKSEIKSLSIVNMLGQTVRTVSPNSRSYKLNFSDLNSGIYFVKASVNNTEGTIRIVKK